MSKPAEARGTLITVAGFTLTACCIASGEATAWAGVGFLVMLVGLVVFVVGRFQE